MKDAIATAEIFVRGGPGAAARRLTLVVGAPERVPGSARRDPEPGDPRAGAAGSPPWSCRVALADLHRPEIVHGPDSLVALHRAMIVARQWLAELEAAGQTLWRDREGAVPFRLE